MTVETPAKPSKLVITEDQQAYAALLKPSVFVARIALIVAFFLYLFSAWNAAVPAETAQRYWHLPADEYVRQTDKDPGWGWTAHAFQVDGINNIAICLLVLLPAMAYLRVVPIFLRQRNWLLAGIVIGELAAMAVAASGLIVAGH